MPDGVLLSDYPRFVPVAMRVCLRVAEGRWNGKYTLSLEASTNYFSWK